MKMTQLSDCLVRVLVVSWCLQHCLLLVDSSCSGGCQRGKPVIKEDLIPALRAYILQQLGVNETAVSNFTGPSATETEEMTESRLLAEIEDSQPVHLQSHTGARAVKTFPAHHASRRTATRRLPTGVSLQRQQYHLAFNKLTQERPSKIELLLYQLDGWSEVDNMQMAEISYKMQVGSQHISIPLVTTTVHSSRKGYQTVDLTTDNPQWLQNTQDGKLELLVTVFTESSNTTQHGLTQNAARFSIDTGNHTTAPRLVLMSEITPASSRRKRNTYGLPTSNVQECGTDSTACCRRPLLIDFKKDLKFDFPFEPRVIDIGYCEGHCRHHRQDYYNILTHVTSRRGDIETVRPCCVPNAFRNVTVSTVINGQPGAYQLPNFKILSCGCT